MTPVQLITLLYVYWGGDTAPNMDAKQHADCLIWLEGRGLILTVSPGSTENGYTMTEKGLVFVDMVINTPFPEQRWSDPRA